MSLSSFFVFITGEQNKKKIIYIPVSEEGNHAPNTEIEMGESLWNTLLLRQPITSTFHRFILYSLVEYYNIIYIYIYSAIYLLSIM